MSTPNPTHIITEHQLRDWYPMTYRPVSKSWLCSCGFKDSVPMPCSSDDVKRAHAAHVVSKLTDAGYSIVPTANPMLCPVCDGSCGWQFIPPSRWEGTCFGTCAGYPVIDLAAAAAEGEKP